MLTPSSNQDAAPALKVPPTLAIIGTILFLSALLARLLPAGEFTREQRTVERQGKQRVEVVVRAGDTPESLARTGAALPGDPATLIDPATHAAPMLPLVAGTRLSLEIPNTWTRTVVVPDSYQSVARETGRGALMSVVSFFSSLMLAPIEAFVLRADIIAFVLLIGGAFALIMATGSIDALLYSTVRAFAATQRGWLMIPICMVLFSACGAMFGMSEEVIPFVMITIPLALRLGYDSITGLCMSFVAAGLGFAGALMNPFTIGIAQGIAELPIYSGMGFRFIVWALVTALGVVYVMLYARRVLARPESSLAFETDKALRAKFATEKIPEHRLGTREVLVLVLLGTVVVLAAYGVHVWDWYINEMAALFLACGILSAAIGRLGVARSCETFVAGARDLVGAALVIAVGRAILVVFEDAKSLDTLLNLISGLLSGTHAIVGAWLMFLFQTFLNFFVNSGSAQASISMPLIAPLSDLIGISRQTAVLAFQFGNGFMDMMIPTSAVTMTVLGIANLPYGRWIKWVLPLQGMLLVYGAIMLAIAVLIGWQ